MNVKELFNALQNIILVYCKACDTDFIFFPYLGDSKLIKYCPQCSNDKFLEKELNTVEWITLTDRQKRKLEKI